MAAAVSSSLVRSKEFKSLLFREERTFRQKVYLVLWFGLPIMIGVWIRISQKSFLAGDLSFETALLLGVIGGRWAGSLGGVLMGIPALLHGEWAAMPFDVLSGFLAGQLRTMARRQGRHLVVLSVHRSKHFSPHSAQSAAAPAVRLADHVFLDRDRLALRADGTGSNTSPRLHLQHRESRTTTGCIARSTRRR